SKEAMVAFNEASPKIIKETVICSLEREDEVVQYGNDAQNILTTGLKFTTQMLESAMYIGEIPILEDQLLWAKDKLPADGVEMEHILVRLRIYREIIIEILSNEHANEIIPFVDWMIERQNELIQMELNED
ncbi:hypothetical protein, partial [Methanobacterium sp.]